MKRGKTGKEKREKQGPKRQKTEFRIQKSEDQAENRLYGFSFLLSPDFCLLSPAFRCFMREKLFHSRFKCGRLPAFAEGGQTLRRMEVWRAKPSHKESVCFPPR
jgi:hypothetical protein